MPTFPRETKNECQDYEPRPEVCHFLLKQIAETITRINERNLLIATVSEEQAQVAREADQNLTSIRELSIQSSAGATQTAGACGEMANLAIGLNRLVARFKV
ncbi:hypothetical protein FBY06_12253 [Pseudomonas sp. SJZ085]|nr:hypothetical protein FBX99_12253 [Pseudomonas sp. SJZ074]TWC21189.1 hypothetical protein FBY00_103205 [Pseudomonas sp. SJZ075]TWC33966.1 hypothetical protein FBY06_12253 [Pseudomonas sp. SJZ085]TWC36669.1 hypothetical protein FBY02_103205 [Pseudomonas sp. SJZ078]TWC57428.1 hypothetical protein FBY11_103205 [Pseudomonas sp. SJZ124]TWC92275.1 hypothetical protein FBY09_10379 [Pseudomonas sp. SJZ101]